MQESLFFGWPGPCGDGVWSSDLPPKCLLFSPIYSSLNMKGKESEWTFSLRNALAYMWPVIYTIGNSSAATLKYEWLGAQEWVCWPIPAMPAERSPRCSTAWPLTCPGLIVIVLSCGILNSFTHCIKHIVINYCGWNFLIKMKEPEPNIFYFHKFPENLMLKSANFCRFLLGARPEPISSGFVLTLCILYKPCEWNPLPALLCAWGRVCLVQSHSAAGGSNGPAFKKHRT